MPSKDSRNGWRNQETPKTTLVTKPPVRRQINVRSAAERKQTYTTMSVMGHLSSRDLLCSVYICCDPFRSSVISVDVLDGDLHRHAVICVDIQ
ncbi:17.7g2 protein [Bracoviriform inaniti]|uniref:17.7g2 protein n=1 Tax=Bracoviriform inaniti TaxID=36344 RepID=A8E104_9VIRU|nr:17.7g2 protein [Bracoviriform inaniti]CAO98974.1 17.7g2 protein [Bracoviriform inaniti]